MKLDNNLTIVSNTTQSQVQELSELTLTQVINKATHKSRSFEQLTSASQEKVLKYISDNKLQIIVPAERGYDILTKTFFVLKYDLLEIPNDPADRRLLKLPNYRDLLNRYHIWTHSEIVKVRVDLPDFDAFYDCLWGDIYNHSCYYGYLFSEEEIKKYNLIVSKLNFDSITDLVYTTTCSDLQADEENRRSSALANRDIIIQKLQTADTIQSYEELLSEFRSLKRKCSRPSRDVVEGIFCDLLLQKKKKRINRFLLERGLSVSDSFFYFGQEVAEKELEKTRPITLEAFLKNGERDIESLSPKELSDKKRLYNSVFSYPNSLYRRRKKLIKSLADKRNSIHKRGGIDSTTAIYYVVYDLYREQTALYENVYTKYFISFKDFVSELNGDLTHCDLKDAPLEIKDVLQYKTDSTTILPSRTFFAQLVLIKEYRDGKYCVAPQYYDSEGKLIKKEDEFRFDFFFDFVHFLRGDLSNADLVMCDGVENIAGLPNLNTDGLKVRSEAAKSLNLPLDLVPIESNNLVSFNQIESNETEFNTEIQSVNDADIVYYNSVAYISDLHLLHRFFANHCESLEDREYVLRRIMESFLDDSSEICLIGGDVASDFSVYQSFVSHLSDSRHSTTKYFFTLGNHEFWSFPNNELKTTINDYRSLLVQNGMYLVQNNLYYLPCTSSKEKPSWLEITECELETISEIELRERTKGSSLIIFGGVGFAGNSTTFNANQGIYRGALDREQEIKECEKFNELHKKVSRALPDQNVIVFTHMPVEDWSFDQTTTDGFIYVNGHRHINRYYDDGQKRLYADNQIGYTRKEISLKHFTVEMRYDLFSNVSDGIHDITANEYRLFHRSIRKGMDFNRDFSTIHMLKREHHYMFLAENSAGELYLLSGGQITKLQPHSLEYYYERMLTYVESVRLFTADYRAFQSRISDEVERLGGVGIIHGCIIDLDWNNHLYVNPIDGTITPYYADSVIDKYIYKNIPSLLKAKMPDVYQKYVEQIEQSDAEASFPILYNQNRVISTDSVYEPDTSMYRVSWIIHRLQALLSEKIILIWNDYIANSPSKEIGRTITQGLIEKK